MEENKKPIIAAGVFKSIAEMLFKGLGKALADNIEYEEEMGVLKQVNRIPIKGTDGREYTLTVKLSPVKNKDSFYYVEAETNAPGLDVSSLNGKSMYLNNTNFKDFKNAIDRLLEQHNMSGKFSKEVQENADKDGFEKNDAASNDDSDNSSDNDEEDIDKIERESQVDKLVKQVEKEFNNKPRVINNGADGVLVITVKADSFDTEENKCDLTLTGEGTFDDRGKAILHPEKITIEPFDSNNKLKTADDFIGEVILKMQDYVQNNGLNPKDLQASVRSSTTIQTTLVKDGKTGEVSLTAIHASTDIKSAFDVVCEIVDNDEFLNCLPNDTEQSFVVLDEGDNYDVKQIEELDPSLDCTYIALFDQLSKVYSATRTYKWAVGETKWSTNSALSALTWPLEDLLHVAATWVVAHCSEYPVIKQAWESNPKFDHLKDTEGKLDIKLVAEAVTTCIEELLDSLEIFYVNLEHQEQSSLDNYINKFKEILAYA
jgi:hypothetical protein